MTTSPRTRAALCLLTLLAACGAGAADPRDDHPDAPPKTNRIAVPELVRQNLGITFAKVERRRVVATLRLPAQVELLPSATWSYHAPLTGRVTFAVDPLQAVQAGELLYTLDSPAWRARQRELGAAGSAIEITGERLRATREVLDACERHEASLQDAHATTARYVAELEQAQRDVGGQGQKLATARVDLAQLGAQLAEASEKHTETEARIAELTAEQRVQQQQLQLLLAGAAATLGVDPTALAEQTPDGPRWSLLTAVEVRATAAGVVDHVAAANGVLLEEHAPVLTVVDPRRVRCRARALQGDLPRLRDGQAATIVPAGVADGTAALTGTLQLGTTGDPRSRTIDLFVTPTPDAVADAAFVRPGIAVFVEIVTAGGERPELAIPSGCVLPDGLDRVFFRRDPNDPDKVIRVVADLGRDDGRWVEVKSGVTDGDEVVAAGAFELVLASSAGASKAGHFHADGTFHAEDHE
ncbi:MAG: efflux RND transporter periplasmic adaptor subunit [Planctomycetota bacterium]